MLNDSADVDPAGADKDIFGLPDVEEHPQVDIDPNSVTNPIELDLELLPDTHFCPDWVLISYVNIQHCYVEMSDNSYWDASNGWFREGFIAGASQTGIESRDGFLSINHVDFGGYAKGILSVNGNGSLTDVRIGQENTGLNVVDPTGIFT